MEPSMKDLLSTLFPNFSTQTLTMLEQTLGMFAYLAVELTILFLAISYLVGVLQMFITPQRVRQTMSSQNGRGYIIAALLGAITPFCSCSTIPFLKGLLRARAGFGPLLVFLFASPLLNPIVIGLLVVTFGLAVAIFYFSVALIVSVSAGFVLEKLGFERYVRDEAYRDVNTSCASKSSCDTSSASEQITQKVQENRWITLWHTTWKDFKQTLPYLLMGISIGAFIYGFVPTQLIVEYAGENKWYAIPIAAVIGIPLYIRASAIIPLSAGLVQKGMALGSVMALIIGSAGASLTEVILLKSIFKMQMIIAFLCVVLGMAVTAGYLYSVIF